MREPRQELPARREGLFYSTPHSRGLNHLLDLFGTVHGAIPEDNEQALWSLREILHLYGEYHRRALACEAREKGWEDGGRDHLRVALEHYANIDHWEDTTSPVEGNTAGYPSFEYDGGYSQPWKVARQALEGDMLHETEFRPLGHEFVADAGPHDFAPLGRFWNKQKCRHCFFTEGEHPTTGWVPARPYGDRR